MKTQRILIFLISTCFLILFFLFFTRFLGNGYDDFRHQHPDERWLIMVVDKLHLFDQLDPDFFAYGALPIYLLRGVAQGGEAVLGRPIATYDGLLVWGRVLVSLLDVGTAILVGLIVWKITRHKQSAVFGLLIYGLMFFPIQNSNFFIVDNFVLFFLTLSTWLLFRYLEKPSLWRLLWLGIALATVLSSKITPIILLPVIVGLVAIRPWQSTSTKKSHSKTQLLNQKLRLKLSPKSHVSSTLTVNQSQRRFQVLKRIILSFSSALGLALIILSFTALFMPYSFINATQFVRELKAQIAMNSNAYVFPYTLQYINTPAYLYHLKQIFLYGAGPIITLLATFGIGLTLVTAAQQFAQRFSKKSVTLIAKLQVFLQAFIDELTANWSLIYLLMALVFFAIIGRSAVKFMRYLLPLYPFFAVMATLAVHWWLTRLDLSWRVKRGVVLVLLVGASFWTISFLHIYLQPHTRVAASEWMAQNIPPGSTLATEHWDDRLPLSGGEKFQYVELSLYDQPDDQNKWQVNRNRLDQADYIVLASNRLFTPLPKLANCARTPQRCYPLTTEYYRQLFAGELGFTKVADFTSRPTLPRWLGGFEIVDDNADLSLSPFMTIRM